MLKIMIQILLSGAGGKMGQVISRSVSERDDCRIAAGIDRRSALFKVNIISHAVTLHRLTAAVYTASGTCHNFNKVIFLFT